ncbi:hypothetical protein TNIN_487661 [Trichonephila inaurata madagascariensis]|uniref:Uncharacterized protein n=1 Tax=Trichonephila inaurata madagascariensis TaxID=2747483 RepID=A0A8X7BZU4_9ARAC|nr:hypothetical protein TNIN_487661 [Trichonephila inaurata madagascariensis]
MCEEFWGLEGSSLDRKEFFGFSRSSWCKSLPRSLSPDERCTRALMAQFQSPVYVQQVGYGDTDPCNWTSHFAAFQKKYVSKGVKHVRHFTVIYHLQHIADPKKQDRKCIKNNDSATLSMTCILKAHTLELHFCSIPEKKYIQRIKHVRHVAEINPLEHINDPKNHDRKHAEQRFRHYQ